MNSESLPTATLKFFTKGATESIMLAILKSAWINTGSTLLMLAGRGSKFTSWTVYYGLQNVHCSVIIFAK